ncbi:uncharacterized protein PAC_04065 [Phialocephala subalpina]|uniref:Heterokaryon incompatibility domain-containing protein n=1 Tax=Phialocephala subalpina TaxID=576137 RepID=A0A1L7WN39_9HELO|nr:uncharacterized protein PAC_04065 [Phialocephala subalpina]
MPSSDYAWQTQRKVSNLAGRNLAITSCTRNRLPAGERHPSSTHQNRKLPFPNEECSPRLSQPQHTADHPRRNLSYTAFRGTIPLGYSLCIVQDDEDMKQIGINSMGFIYANSSVTIIARKGQDANYRLRGLRGISQPRNTSQEIFEVGKNHKFLKTCDWYAKDCTWEKRGWTYQEEVFSRRTLTFHKDRVWWRCACSSFEEDVTPHLGYIYELAGAPMYPCRRSRKTLTSTTPDLQGYKRHVSAYNARELTNPENAQAGFAGIMTALKSSFSYGFLCGLPALFLDAALCWQPFGTAIRRRDRSNSASAQASLPS